MVLMTVKNAECHAFMTTAQVATTKKKHTVVRILYLTKLEIQMSVKSRKPVLCDVYEWSRWLQAHRGHHILNKSCFVLRHTAKARSAVKQSNTCIHNCRSPINLTCMSLDCGRRLENLRRNRENIQTPPRNLMFLIVCPRSIPKTSPLVVLKKFTYCKTRSLKIAVV